MKKLLTLLNIFIICNYSYSQCNGRYETEIFDSVTINNDIYYSDVYFDNEHQMDIYFPESDTVNNRPLIIFMHGGSFINGNKSNIACVDFCKSFARRGYVAASINYRLNNNSQAFALSQQEQYVTVLKATSDLKGAIRYFRKSVADGNPYGIDGNTVFIGGASAGAVAAIHSAYIDDIIDLPTSRSYQDILTGQTINFNMQALLNSIGGSLEGDAGNNNYSSSVSGIFNFAGGINDINWIDNNDEPIVSCQGDLDNIVYYDCGPGLGIPSVFTLCGIAEIHPKANLEGLTHDYLLFSGSDHEWCSAGNSNLLFVQAINFTSNFFFPLLPCNSATIVNNLNKKKVLIDVIDVLGRKSKVNENQLLIYIYSDRSYEYKIIIN